MSDKIVEIYKKGDTGQSAYEAAVEAGFVGTKAQWVAAVEAARLDAEQSALEALSYKNASDANASQTALDRTAVRDDKNASDADVLLTHADVLSTHADQQTVAADKLLTSEYKDTAFTQAGIATTKAGEALSSKNSADADVLLTHADVVTTVSNASTATTKAGEALSSANAANQSKIDAQAIATAQGKKYLGDKATDPTLDNDGAALVAGALYFNTTSQMIRRYSGSAWVNNFNPTVQQVTGSSTTDVISQNATTTIIGDDELTTAESIAQLRKELDGVKSLLTKFIAGEAWIDVLNVMTTLNFYGETNLIVKATVAPIPDFKGQFFINLSTGVGYMATGTTAISDWKQIT